MKGSLKGQLEHERKTDLKERIKNVIEMSQATMSSYFLFLFSHTESPPKVLAGAMAPWSQIFLPFFQSAAICTAVRSSLSFK